jgi:hypothetical protein
MVQFIGFAPNAEGMQVAGASEAILIPFTDNDPMI